MAKDVKELGKGGVRTGVDRKALMRPGVFLTSITLALEGIDHDTGVLRKNNLY